MISLLPPLPNGVKPIDRLGSLIQTVRIHLYVGDDFFLKLNPSALVVEPGQLSMDESVVVRAGQSSWQLPGHLLNRSTYFQVQLNGRYRPTRIDQQITFTLDQEWEQPLSNYIYFLRHQRLDTRITGDDYALALYLDDPDYLRLCNEAPRLSNKLMKRLRHQHKLKRLWSRLDQKGMTRRLYFSELSDSELELVLKHWPEQANYVEMAREWVVRKGIQLLPTIFFESPGIEVLSKLPYSSLWARWLLQSLRELEQARRGRAPYPTTFLLLGQTVERLTQNMILAGPKVELIDIVELPRDDAWYHRAVQCVRQAFLGYRRLVKTLSNQELKIKASCIGVLVD